MRHRRAKKKRDMLQGLGAFYNTLNIKIPKSMSFKVY